MFGFGKKAREERAKNEAAEIGARHVALINTALENWREILEMRRTMTEDMFDEAVVGIVPEDGLSFEQIAEIHALALFKNWNAGINEYVEKFDNLLSDETHGVIEILAMRPNVNDQLSLVFNEVTDGLESHVNTTIHEAVTRRGENPTV